MAELPVGTTSMPQEMKMENPFPPCSTVPLCYVKMIINGAGFFSG